MALYEHIFIARPDISAQQVEGLTKMITDTITDDGGKICKHEYWGLRTLAYPIEKNTRGHYTLLNIDAEHSAMLEVERKISLNDDVMRHLSIRVEEHEEGESVQLRAKSRKEDDDERDSDDERGRGRDRDRGDRGERGDRDRGYKGERRKNNDRDDDMEGMEL